LFLIIIYSIINLNIDIDIETVQNENTYYWRYCFKTGM